MSKTVASPPVEQKPKEVALPVPRVKIQSNPVLNPNDETINGYQFVIDNCLEQLKMEVKRVEDIYCNVITEKDLGLIKQHKMEAERIRDLFITARVIQGKEVKGFKLVPTSQMTSTEQTTRIVNLINRINEVVRNANGTIKGKEGVMEAMNLRKTLE